MTDRQHNTPEVWSLRRGTSCIQGQKYFDISSFYLSRSPALIQLLLAVVLGPMNHNDITLLASRLAAVRWIIMTLHCWPVGWLLPRSCPMNHNDITLLASRLAATPQLTHCMYHVIVPKLFVLHQVQNFELWYDMIRYMIWYDTIWYMIWYDI